MISNMAVTLTDSVQLRHFIYFYMYIVCNQPCGMFIPPHILHVKHYKCGYILSFQLSLTQHKKS